MSENGAPRLYIHKPKKGHVKQARRNASKDFSPLQDLTPPPLPSSSSLSSTPTIAAPVKESFVRRYKYLWPLLLTVNLAYGAYLYKRIKTQRASEEEETAIATDSVSATSHRIPESSFLASAPSTQVSAIADQTSLSPAITTSQKVAPNVPDEQKRELFKWILDEKRKIKTRNVEE